LLLKLQCVLFSIENEAHNETSLKHAINLEFKKDTILMKLKGNGDI